MCRAAPDNPSFKVIDFEEQISTYDGYSAGVGSFFESFTFAAGLRDIGQPGTLILLLMVSNCLFSRKVALKNLFYVARSELQEFHKLFWISS